MFFSPVFKIRLFSLALSEFNYLYSSTNRIKFKSAKVVGCLDCVWFQTNLTELKTFGSPPEDVTNVTAAVMVLVEGGSKGKVPKDRSWRAAKLMMGKVRNFPAVRYLFLDILV